MTCFKPLTAYVGEGRSRNGRRRIVWNELDAMSSSELKLPCGQCFGCREDRARELALRAVHEAKFHERNCFVTLTYDEEHLPEHGSLCPKDLQLFWKRLRRAVAPQRIRFFACGEYGELRERPHYHACVFGEDFSADREAHSRSRDSDSTIFTSELLAETWGKGFTSVGSLTFKSAAYVARYALKKLNGKALDVVNPDTGLRPYEVMDWENGAVVKIEREFSRFSLKPGIGRGWLEAFWSDVFPADFCVLDGAKRPVPKYYRRVLRELDPDLYEELAEIRELEGLKHEADRTPERLAVRERVRELVAKHVAERGLSLGRRTVL